MYALRDYGLKRKKGESKATARESKKRMMGLLADEYVRRVKVETKKKKKTEEKRAEQEKIDQLAEVRQERLRDEAAKLAEQQRELADNIRKREEEVAQMMADADRAEEEEAREQEAAERVRREADCFRAREAAREPAPVRWEQPFRDPTHFARPTGALRQRQRRQARRRKKKREEMMMSLR